MCCADPNLKAIAVAARGRPGQLCSTSLLFIRDVTSAGEGLKGRGSLCREQERQRCVLTSPSPSEYGHPDL